MACPNAATEAWRIVVRGRVQGVGFRWWTRSVAARISITGWVANRADGTVEIFAEGEPYNLESFFAEVQKGPPLSRVESASKRPCEVEGFSDFSIRGW